VARAHVWLLAPPAAAERVDGGGSKDRGEGEGPDDDGQFGMPHRPGVNRANRVLGPPNRSRQAAASALIGVQFANMPVIW
jgi:hypothetical protein